MKAEAGEKPAGRKQRGLTSRYRLPAEWERHAATWLSWPHQTSDWAGKMGAIPHVFGEIARKLATAEKVRILCNSEATRQKAKRLMAKLNVSQQAIEYLLIPTDRGWNRDCGPIFAWRRTTRGRERVILRFRFNGWGKYKHYRKDDAVPARASRWVGVELVPARHGGREVVLEGGSVEVNGKGTLIATEQCLLHPTRQVRNQGFTRKDYEEVFASYLGATNVIWLGKGIAGDDTNGHVDDVCRFVDERTVVLCQEDNPSDLNHRALAENRERLQGARLSDGSKLEVVLLPMPEPLFYDGWRLPASYANFYIANEQVLVPTFNDPQDRRALGILSELFPHRSVVGIHASDLVWGLGTIHCLTREEPAA